jgi:type II secretory pathway pseudopilin PulG
MKLYRAFSLSELLVIIAIILVLAALLFPVYANSRREGYRTAFGSNLRQLSVGLNQYLEDSNDKLEFKFWVDQRSLLPYIKSKELFHTPADPYPDGVHSQAGRILGSPVSVWPLLTIEPKWLKNMMQEPNYTMFVCPVFGTRDPNGSGKPSNSTYTGRMLRVRKDGSIQNSVLNLQCLKDGNSISSRVSYWQMFSDQAEPDEVILESIGEVPTIVPCKDPR